MRGKTFAPNPKSAPPSVASMRPPQNAGENGSYQGIRASDDMRFNEAPAECGGKLASFYNSDFRAP